MKIAFISQPFEHVVTKDNISSLAIWTYEVAQRLVNDYGYEVIIYSRRGSSQDRFEDLGEIKYLRYSITPEEYILKFLKLIERFFSNQNSKKPLFASSVFFLGYILFIANNLRKQNCDVVHIFNFSQFIPIIRFFNPKIKIVLNMQCEWLTQLDYRTIDHRLSGVDLILGCSDYITEKVTHTFKHYSDRCFTIHNGVDIDHFDSLHAITKNNSKGGKRLLFVGRISPEKGIHLLIEAFKSIAEHDEQATLDIVGPVSAAPYEYIVLISDDDEVKTLRKFYKGKIRRDDYLNHLIRLIPDQLKNRVKFTGPVPHSRVAEYFSRADILINPSLSEAFGMSLTEAMANKMPVIASRVGGMTDIVVEGETGLMFTQGDSSDLTKCILQLINDREVMKCMGIKGHSRAQNLFTWDKVTYNLRSVMGRLFT